MGKKRTTIDSATEPIVLAAPEEVTHRLKIKMIDLDSEISKINMQALESSRRMVCELETINEEGVHILTTLEDQDEQLDKVEENLVKVEEDLSVVKRSVTTMEEFCGCGLKKILCYPFKCLRKKERIVKKEDILESIKKGAGSELTVTFRPNKRRESAGDYMKRLTVDSIEDELEKNLMKIDQSLDSIKHLAVDMHVQLKMQEPKLNRIEQMAETNDVSVGGMNERVVKIINN